MRDALMPHGAKTIAHRVRSYRRIRAGRSSMRIADLVDKRVAIWGFGREGGAALAALRKRQPARPLTLFCSAAEAEAARAFDRALDVIATEPDATALSGFDVVVKSPGISAYKPAITEAKANGTFFSSGTALWFAENPHARVTAVTGTKGKSTTSAMLAHLARSLGIRTALAGNIGLPLLELDDERANLWVIELSSFQTGEAGPVELGVFTSLYQEHLDWHGSPERYVADKLKLAAVSREVLVNALQPTLLDATAKHPHRILFGHPDGWHVANGSIRRGSHDAFPIDKLAAPGLHNALNASAALCALEALGLDALAAAPALADFRPLPHRLQPLGRHGGLDWINDSIGTTPQAVVAALASLPNRAVTVLVGGHDRGVDWAPFVEAVRASPPHAIVCMGANGPRIEAALTAVSLACPVWRVSDLGQAVGLARQCTPEGGVVLMSPGAPSFDQFANYAERGQCFAALAGFDGLPITGIDGLGVA